MFANGGDTEGLFRAGIMNSGSSVPTGDITDIQSTYDFVVDQVGCSDESDSLACLRTVSTLELLMAANKAPTLVGYTVRVWLFDLSAKAESWCGCRVWLSRS